MRRKKKIVEEIEMSRLINIAIWNLMVTFQAQTFTFASNISCQLNLGGVISSPLMCIALLFF